MFKSARSNSGDIQEYVINRAGTVRCWLFDVCILQGLNIQIPTAYSRGTGENRQYSEAEDLGHSA